MVKNKIYIDCTYVMKTQMEIRWTLLKYVIKCLALTIKTLPLKQFKGFGSVN